VADAPPRFISFEGIDGSGKTTQARLLADHLSDMGRDVLLTREPGGSPGAEEIRALLTEGARDRWSPHCELLLFNAARRDHLERTIRPALDAGRTVVCDRFADSTRVYQGLRGADLREAADRLHDLMIGAEPDLTILVDLDPDVAHRRSVVRLRVGTVAGAAEDRFESFGPDLQARLRHGFLDLARTIPRIVVVDGAGTTAEVAARVAALSGLAA
jgi:dTMP kinase